MSATGFRSYFSQVFDVAIVGAGYAGFAAALRLHGQGKRVLLVSRQADLLPESGRSFSLDTGSLSGPEWNHWLTRLHAAGGHVNDLTDGAIAEVVATHELVAQKIPTLYYVTPAAVELEGQALAGLIVATKAGARRIMARQWIDATETGELAQLLTDLPAPVRQSVRLHAFYNRGQWHGVNRRTIAGGSDSTLRLQLRPTVWPTERCLEIILPPTTCCDKAYQAILPALQTLHAELPELMPDAVLTHMSVNPLAHYAANPVAITLPVRNVALAAPSLAATAITDLADRFKLGLAAAEQLRSATVHEPGANLASRPIAPITPVKTLETQVLVAGGGTGGAMAAIASARTGAQTMCIDPLNFAGGIGAGGGIHWYYLGVCGGLQEELDRRVTQIMPLFGTKKQVQGFHPDAKKLALAQMLDEAGVSFVRQTTLFDVSVRDGCVEQALAAGPQGVVAIRAKAWVDSTGDADLCAMAGAEFEFGREGDGMLHAYSQSSGRLRAGESDAMWMSVVNYDAGWVDPCDPEDLTRARLAGINQYAKPSFDNASRPTYIAPAIGLRQSRQIVTDYQLSLADLIERREFADAIGYTGSHYDNHAVDYEFESNEGLFWVWVCRQWRTRTACQMPYRMILPRGLRNAWVACRAAGVSADAHHSCRMQRDVQRLGEVAGYAAGLAVTQGVDARSIDFAQLQQKLAQTGAIDLAQADVHQEFGPIVPSDAFADEIKEAQVAAALAELDAGKVGAHLWVLYRAGDAVRTQVKERLNDQRPVVSFMAAAVLAMLGDAAAQPRLLRAIEDREYGFEEAKDAEKPEQFVRHVPHWLQAVSLLRICGDGQALPTFEAMLRTQKPLLLNVCTSVARTLEYLLQRGVSVDRDAVVRVLELMESSQCTGTFVAPQRRLADHMAPTQVQTLPPATAEDHTWQLHLVTARLRVALGLSVHEAALACASDPRSLVRRAFAPVLASARGAEHVASRS